MEPHCGGSTRLLVDENQALNLTKDLDFKLRPIYLFTYGDFIISDLIFGSFGNAVDSELALILHIDQHIPLFLVFL